MKNVILGLDLGTTAIKIALYTSEGELLDVETAEYNLITIKVNWVEQDPEIYWQSIIKCLNSIRKNIDFSEIEIKAIGISAQGETLFFLDENGCSLRNAIVWMDNRATCEAKMLKEKFGDGICYKTTGQVSFEPSWPASKILWVKNNQPDIFKKIKHYLLIEDYIIYRLTGRIVSEGSLLCSTTYWNINNKSYWQEMLDYISISSEQLPEIYESGEIVGCILPEVAEELGVNKNIIVCTGALDQAAGAIGVGNIYEGVFSENIGAALAICVPINKPIFSEKRTMPLHYFAIPNMYMIHTFTPGGITLKWFRDNFCKYEYEKDITNNTDTYMWMNKEVSKIEPGCEGLLMLPYLTGSFAPDVNSNAKGVYFGFTLKHKRAHFIRAIMESIGFIIKRNIDTLAEIGINVSEIRSLGGGSKSDIWNQIKADITGKNIITMQSKEAACLGAAILAGKAIGLFSSIENAVKNMVKEKDKFIPDKKNSLVYKESYNKYKKLFFNLKSLFDI